MSTPQIPGFQYAPASGGHTKEIDDSIVWLRQKVLSLLNPSPSIPQQVEQVIQNITVNSSGGGGGGGTVVSGVQIIVGTHAARLTSPTPALGSMFYETDRTTLYIVSGAGIGQWTWLAGEMSGTLNPSTLPADLGSADLGFIFNSIDFDRLYTWTGSAWIDSPGQPARAIYFFQIDPTGSGWQICDGSTNIRISNPDATTQLIQVPNLTASVFPRGGPVYSGPTANNAVAPGATSSAPIFVGNTTTTNGPSATTTVQSGAGATVASSGHTHQDLPTGSVSTPTITVDATGLPKLMDLVPWARL